MNVVKLHLEILNITIGRHENSPLLPKKKKEKEKICSTRRGIEKNAISVFAFWAVK